MEIDAIRIISLCSANAAKESMEEERIIRSHDDQYTTEFSPGFIKLLNEKSHSLGICQTVR